MAKCNVLAVFLSITFIKYWVGSEKVIRFELTNIDDSVRKTCSSNWSAFVVICITFSKPFESGRDT
jgi:hypothetical protein